MTQDLKTTFRFWLGVVQVYPRLVTLFKLGFISVCMIGIGWQAYRNLSFLLTHNYESPAFEPRMTMDSANYVRAGRRIAQSPAPWFTSDHRHGTGMQLVAGLVFRVTGARHAGGLKVFNWACWVLLLISFFAFTVRVTHSWANAALVAFLISFSNPLQKFCATAQYEILLTLVFSVALHLLISSSRWAHVAAGACITLLAIFRIHFAATAFFLLAGTYLRGGPLTRRTAVGLLLGFTATTLLWNGLYSLKSGQVLFFQNGVGDELHLALNPSARGQASFYPQITEGPTGIAFVTQRPLSYLRLLAARFTFLSGLRADLWFVESSWTLLLSSATGLPLLPSRVLFLSIAAALLGAGLRTACQHARIGGRWEAFLPLAILGPVLLAQLISNSSNRYLLPVIPSFTFFQALFLFETGRNFLDGRKTEMG